MHSGTIFCRENGSSEETLAWRLKPNRIQRIAAARNLDSPVSDETQDSQASEPSTDQDFDVLLNSYDPLIGILNAFDSIPVTYREAMFTEIQDACVSKNLVRLKEAIAGWAATAEIYANPLLHAQVEDARRGRTEVSDWLCG